MSGPEHKIGEPTELAALYLTGAMTDDERVAFEAHIADGCPVCDAELRSLDDVAAALVHAVEPVSPSIMAQVETMARANESLGELSPQQAEGLAGLVGVVAANIEEIRSAARYWEPVVTAGVAWRRLTIDNDRGRITALVRMEPGATFASHWHDQDEQCVVLHGDLDIGECRLRAGEYHYWKAGERQPLQTTAEGCLLLVNSPLDWHRVPPRPR